MRKEGRTRLGLAGPFGVSYSRVIFGWNLGGNKMDPKGFWFHRQWPSIMGGERKRERPSCDGAEEYSTNNNSISFSLLLYIAYLPVHSRANFVYFSRSVLYTRAEKSVGLRVMKNEVKSYRFLAPEDRLDLDLLEENKLRVKLC